MTLVSNSSNLFRVVMREKIKYVPDSKLHTVERKERREAMTCAKPFFIFLPKIQNTGNCPILLIHMYDREGEDSFNLTCYLFFRKKSS